MSSNQVHTISIMTATTATTTSTNLPIEQTQKKTDAFSLYSDDSFRMKKLLMKDDDESDDNTQASLPSSDSEEISRISSKTKEPSPRKTRVTTEAHPCLIFDDLFDDEEDECSLFDGFEEDEYSFLMNLLQLRRQQDVVPSNEEARQ